VRDVSGHPDISDLYLAADVLVTDYSSSMFDFAVTGKPIVLYAYDLAHYRDRLRGFTLDLAAEAPGPIVLDQEALTDALLDLPAVAAAHADRYARFVARYCALEDGRASARVVAAVWPS
jgi:CDP-glycerol glycerophosphotransferase